ncbi:MAG: carbohydrate ABC transporter permease [Lachnospiraceae bacterium]|nr:carbohydrate ABC transporter permease [Lachnospiraceae bacterium]
MHKKKKRQQVVYFLAASLCVIILIFPIYWMVISSFKTDGELFAVVPTFFPKKLTVQGYVKMFGTKFSGQSIVKSFFNSFYISIITAVITTVLATLSAYGLARFNFKINKALLLIFLIAQMMPTVLFLAPLYLTFKKVGIMGTYFPPAIFVTLHSVPFSVMMLRPYFLGVPKELEDSAVIDGCNKFSSFIRIMLPMIYPGVVVVAVLSFLWGWGDMVGAMTFCSTGNMQPLSLNMYRAMANDSTDWAMLMAFATIIVVPAVVLFLSLQKFIISGLTAGAVKG